MTTDTQRRHALFERLKRLNPTWSQVGQLYLVAIEDLVLAVLFCFCMFEAMNAIGEPLSLQDVLAQLVLVIPAQWGINVLLTHRTLACMEQLTDRWERK